MKGEKIGETYGRGLQNFDAISGILDSLKFKSDSVQCYFGVFGWFSFFRSVGQLNILHIDQQHTRYVLRKLFGQHNRRITNFYEVRVLRKPGRKSVNFLVD